jgi:hypothetical protein
MVAIFKNLAVEGYFSTPSPKMGIAMIFHLNFYGVYSDLTMNP